MQILFEDYKGWSGGSEWAVKKEALRNTSPLLVQDTQARVIEMIDAIEGNGSFDHRCFKTNYLTGHGDDGRPYGDGKSKILTINLDNFDAVYEAFELQLPSSQHDLDKASGQGWYYDLDSHYLVLLPLDETPLRPVALIRCL